jgi:hypothetical protein
MIKSYFSVILFSLILACSSLFAQPCTPDIISFSTTPSGCTGNNGSATAIIPGGIPPYTYVWNTVPAQTSQTAANLGPGNYTLVITDSMGCIDTGSVTVYAVSAPSICMVTVNGNSTNNIVYWDRSLYDGIDSFIVYRETSPSSYSRLAAVSNDSLGQYIDTARSIGPANGNPNLASYRYKLQVLDTCGNYSLLSPYHNTIYIVDDGLGAFSWSIPYTIEGQANPVANYILLCDTANVDVWGPVSVVSGSVTTATDPGFSNHSSIANWRVKTGWSISCDPAARTTVNTTRSNIKSGSLSTGITREILSASVVVFPNPASDQLIISLSPQISKALLKIENITGQTLLQENINSAAAKVVDVSIYPKGIYLLSIESNNSKIFKKIVID